MVSGVKENAVLVLNRTGLGSEREMHCTLEIKVFSEKEEWQYNLNGKMLNKLQF